ncbi:MAG: MCE family protein [Bacteriovoracaceae bacterium]|nr:MCE family protein [Bacteriovoracaceae bacterium]
MNELKVGILAIVSILFIVFMSLKIVSNQSGFKEHVAYRVMLDDASGIFQKSPIKVAGVNAGRIKKIELEGAQALVTFEILKTIPITSNAKMRIKTVGFLGDKYLDISLGKTDGASILPAESFIVAETGSGLEDVADEASLVIRELKEITLNVKKALVNEDGENQLKVIVNNIRDLSDTLANVTSRNEQNLNRILDNLNRVSASLAQELDKENPESLMVDFKKIGPVLDKTKAMMDDLNVIVADVKAGKGTVGKLLRDEQVVDQVNATLKGVRRIVNRFDTLQTRVSFFAGYNSQADSHVDFNIDLYTSPERFYRFGVAASEYGPLSEKETTTTVGNVTTVENRKARKVDTYRFNAQFGKRFQALGFRAGLVESTGGLGVDYYLSEDRTRFSFEAFDFRKSFNPNLRFITDIHLWNIFYARLAIEDIISKTHDQSFTVAAGLRFTDEDLKGLFALFLR